MSVMLAVMAYPGANATVARHWPYFENQKADWVYGIGTTDGKCEWPEGVSSIDIGSDRYIDGSHLPRRVLDTIETMLIMPWRVLMLVEYDTVIFKPLPAENVKTAAAHFAGGQVWSSKARWFAHNPWVFERESATIFLKWGRQAIADGLIPERTAHNPSVPEASPDVFFGLICEMAHIPVEFHLWDEYSRNSFDIPGHLEEAREAYRNGVHCIHGIKTREQLEFIVT